MVILAFDPGGHTGWCVIDSEYTLIASGEIPDWHGVKNLFNEHQPDIIVYETFQLYAWKAQSLSWNTFVPCEAIGVIKFIAEELNIPCVGQGPSERKFFTDERLKTFDMWPESKHSRDAIRHALFFLTFGIKKYK